ncbi:hypothetical protein LEMLEM_LOCUS8680, partial [Lemmus lemmus]
SRPLLRIKILFYFTCYYYLSLNEIYCLEDLPLCLIMAYNLMPRSRYCEYHDLRRKHVMSLPRKKEGSPSPLPCVHHML